MRLHTLAIFAALLLPCARPAHSSPVYPGGRGTQQDSAQAQEIPRVVSIQVEGERRYSRSQLRSALGQRAGEPLDVRVVDDGIKKLWSSFHVKADVAYRDVPGGVEILLRVTELPSDREPRFIGNEAIDLKTIQRWALLDTKTELFVHQAERVRQRVIEGYLREGFRFVEVSIVSRSTDKEGTALAPDVIFDIREGPKVRVKGFRIRGNDSMLDRRFLYFFKSGLSHLAKRKLSSPGLFSWRGTPFVEETLAGDLLAMRNVYRERGWLDAVVEVEKLEFNDQRTGVIVHVVVDEGEPYTVSSLSIEAVDWESPDDPRDPRLKPVDLVFPERRLRRRCELKPGVRYEKLTLERDRIELRDYFGDHGYLTHPSLPRRLNWDFIDPVFVYDVENHTVDVTYRILQGRKLWIGEILFAGSHHTRDRILRREVSVFPGQAADLEEINRSLARIHGTRFFSDDFNRLEHRDPTYRFLPRADDPSMVDLEFEVDEGRVVDFNLSGGVDSNDGAFGLISLTMRNFDITDRPSSFWRMWSEIYHKEAFHGAGQLMQLELAPGTQLSRFRARFIEPDIFRSHLKPISLDADLVKRIRRYTTHDEDRFEQRLKFGRKFTFDLFAAVGFVRTELDVSDLDSGGVPPLLRQQRDLGDHEFQGLTLDFTSRSLDNYVLPHKGYTVALANGLYGGDFGADVDFVETEFRGDWYMPVYEKADGTRPVLHVELDGGVSHPYGDTDDIPYTERYFIGGARTLRGFDFREVGPFHGPSGVALGGETFVSGSLEFQYPLHSVVQPGTYKRLESLRGTVFVDFGVLDPDSFSLDLDELRASAGFGIGLAWPIPIILNFGFPIRERDGDGKQVFSFNLGL